MNSQEELDLLLAENDRRLSLAGAPFIPRTGEGAPGRRFPLSLGDDDESLLYLPEEMKASPVVTFLLRHGSVGNAAVALSRKYPGHSPGECREILAERLVRERIRHDFPFWASAFVRIKRKGGGDDVPFVLNRPQRRLVEEFEEARRAHRPLRLILLKARQWGGSTCSQLYMAWLQMVHRRGLNSLIIAHQGAGSDEIKDMFDRMIHAYPVLLLHKEGETFDEKEKKLERVGGSGSIFRVPQRNCKIKIGTAERPDSCRGGDYNLVHLSEVGIWKSTDGKRPEDIVRSACSGILLKPLTMIVLESTANGTGNFFHREYQAAKRGESQFRPMFVSWYEIDQYSLPFESENSKRAFAKTLIERKNSDESGERSQSGRYMWSLWERGATLEAIHWYESERRKYSDHSGMASEYPSDDLEAFAHSGARVFSRETVERLRRGCMAPLRTGSVNVSMKPGKFHYSDAVFTDETDGFFRIWEMPETSTDCENRVLDRYLTVMDIGGRSMKADWTVITVFDRLLMMDGDKPVVVAQWRGHGDIDVVARQAAAIAGFYDESLLVIESNTIETRSPDRLNDADQTPYIMAELRDTYPNLYARRNPSVDVRDSAPVKYGFHTNVSTKPMVISTLVKAVREGLYVERDEQALEEMLQYEQRPNGSYGAIAGCHDDILMTRAIGLHICFYEMEPPRIAATRSRRRNNDITESTIF